MRGKVIVIGGGIGGLTAAHELSERGFAVEIYDLRNVPGGKSRTIDVPDSASGTRFPLPGEHGFRFFPAFYHHLPDTMRRIPFGRSGTVFDNLVSATQLELAQKDLTPVELPTRFPRTFEDWALLIADLHNPGVKFEPGELRFFASRLWQVATSCAERRLAELETVSWWDFIGAASRSANYQRMLANGLSRSLVAAQPQLASARTIGQVQVHLIVGTFLPDMTTDRVLNGPTSFAFLNPWLDYLKTRGVKYNRNSEAVRIAVESGRVSGITVRDTQSGIETELTGDWFVAALPVERMAMLLNPDLLREDPALGRIGVIANNVRWMNGLQFFLKSAAPVIHGHVLYLDSPWAITSISQGQFWKAGLGAYGDGTVADILSVDISDWTAPGTYVNRPAMNLDKDEIAREVWQELKASLNVGGANILRDDMLHNYFLDTDIVEPNPPGTTINLEPLFINTPNSWQLRPPAACKIPNLVLAADYVQTNSDLACMEAANEAARRAVNAILDHGDISGPRCRIFAMDMPALLAPWRAHDKCRFDRGEPWDGRLFSRSAPLGGIVTTDRKLRAAMLRKMVALHPRPAPAPTLADDGYHFHDYADQPECFWYIEWWYFNFVDPRTRRSGMLTFASFNPGNIDGLATASFNAVVFGSDGIPITVMDYYSGAELTASDAKADVTIAGSRLTARDASCYDIMAKSKDGRFIFDLTYRTADDPQLLANKCPGYEPWEVSSWLVWMPSARVSGSVTVDGKSFELESAQGYHDHDWGIWAVPVRTWSWAEFAAPDKSLSVDLGFHAAFQESIAYVRYGTERILFPVNVAQDDWETWNRFWRYPTHMHWNAVDASGNYRIELDWRVIGTAALWKYPLLVFEQTAHFTGTLYRGENGCWTEVTSINEQGFCEFTDTWLGIGKPDVVEIDFT